MLNCSRLVSERWSTVHNYCGRADWCLCEIETSSAFFSSSFIQCATHASGSPAQSRNQPTTSKHCQTEPSSTTKQQHQSQTTRGDVKDSSKSVKPGRKQFADPAKRPKAPAPRLYGWGLAMSGALGEPELIRARHHTTPLKFIISPYRIPFAELQTVTDIACGYGFSVHGRRVYGTGLNSSGQLGFHINPSHPEYSLHWLWRPMPYKFPSDVSLLETPVVSVACGRAHTIMATNKAVFTAGSNSHGQCGRPIVDNEDSGLAAHNVHRVCMDGVPLFDKEYVKSVGAGLDHSLVLTSGGRVFACGLGADMQTGSGSGISVQPQLTAVTGDIDKVHIIQVSCTADSVLALDNHGQVYGWGNNECNQLLPTSDTGVSVPTHLAHITQATRAHGKIVEVACGGSASLALTATGDVFVWGAGVLGFGPDVVDIKHPRRLPRPYFGAFDDADAMADSNKGRQGISHVQHIYAGLMHFAAVTAAGTLYTWGKNRYMVLGLKQQTDQFFPLQVDYAGVTKKIALGADHTLAITERKRKYETHTTQRDDRDWNL